MSENKLELTSVSVENVETFQFVWKKHQDMPFFLSVLISDDKASRWQRMNHLDVHETKYFSVTNMWLLGIPEAVE